MDERNHCLDHSGMVNCTQALRERIAESEKLTNVRFEAIDRALNISKHEMERRLEGMNEFREQLALQAKNFVNKSEMDHIAGKIENRIDTNTNTIRDIKQDIDRQFGARRWSDYMIMVGLSFLVAVLARYFVR